jgi:hypothetical protein
MVAADKKIVVLTDSDRTPFNFKVTGVPGSTSQGRKQSWMSWHLRRIKLPYNSWQPVPTMLHKVLKLANNQEQAAGEGTSSLSVSRPSL